MKRLIAVGLLLAGLSVTTSKAQACTRDQQERLLTATLYNEARPTAAGHASVASTVFNRQKSGKWGRTLCQVITSPHQYVHRQPRSNGVKLAMSRASARAFLNEWHTHGRLNNAIYARLRGYDSFHTAGHRRSGRAGRITIEGNTFYIAGRN